MPNVLGPVASVHQEVQSQFQVLDPEKCALMKGNGYWICLKISYSKSSACSYHPFSLRSRMTQILRHLETFSTSALPASPASPLSVAGGVPKSWASWHSEYWVESTVSESLRHQINSGTMWNWAAWEGSSNYYVESDESVHFPPAEPLWLQELKLWDSWTSTSADGTRNTPNSAEMWDLVEERRSREATLFQMSSSRVRSPLRSLA